MTPQLRQRLIGAAVLVAGAVIFIPMLLDEDALQNSFDHDRLTVQPPEPGAPGQTDALDARMLERAERGARGESANPTRDASTNVGAQRTDPSRTTPQPVAEPTPKAVAAQPGTVVADKPITVSPPVPATETPIATAVPPNQSASRQSAAKPVTQSVPPPASESQPEAWVVQLGVFRDEAAARALEQRVRGAGYNAYVDTLPSDDGTSYRVRVGPEPRRANAETTRAQLQQLLKLNGFVVPHS